LARPWMLCLLLWMSMIGAYHCRGTLYLMSGYPMLALAWAWLCGFYWYGHRRGTTMILFLAVCAFFGRSPNSLAAVTIALAASVLIAAPSIPVPRVLRAPLLYLGELSYPLYLFHWPTLVGLFALRMVLDPIAWVIGSIGMSMIGYHLIDKLFRTSPLARAAHLSARTLDVRMAAPVQP
jgi:peptidoglycan/LPS O-acetylase OafA/YrhL